MDTSPPRFNFMSSMFVIGFGVGAFVGVALALVAISLARGSDASGKDRTAVAVASATSLPGVTATLTPVVLPKTIASLNVYLGPGEAYAIIGVVARGEEVSLVGRDSTSTWAAIRFPPDSAGRGWVRVDQLDGVTGFDKIAIAAPTPLPRNVVPSSTFNDSGSSSGVDAPSTSVATTRTPAGGTSASGTSVASNPTATATPRVATGPSDLLVINITLQADNHVAVVIGNRGPGDLTQPFQVLISDNAGHNETLTANSGRLFPLGTTLTLQSSAVVVSSAGDVSAFIDPFGALSDPDRSNNGMQVSLAPPPTAIPTPN